MKKRTYLSPLAELQRVQPDALLTLNSGVDNVMQLDFLEDFNF